MSEFVSYSCVVKWNIGDYKGYTAFTDDAFFTNYPLYLSEHKKIFVEAKRKKDAEELVKKNVFIVCEREK